MNLGPELVQVGSNDGRIRLDRLLQALELRSMRVLFIGNSYTYFHDMPKVFQIICSGNGHSVETRMVASAGKSLEWHWYNPETLDAIAEGGWDFTVLQDHSLQAMEDPERLRRSVRRFHSRIEAVGGATVPYMTWARRHIPEMQKAIAEVYRSAAEEVDGLLSPVGLAFERALGTDQSLTLYEEDRSHPTILGTYLTACSLHATLFEETPVGATSELELLAGVLTVIRGDIAETLQESAWITWQNHGVRLS